MLAPWALVLTEPDPPGFDGWLYWHYCFILGQPRVLPGVTLVVVG